MIIDRLEKLSMYVVLNPLFADVIDFLRCHDLQTLEVGKYPIRDNKVFLNLQMAKGRSQDEAVLETHIEMIDIQIPISAEETFGYLQSAYHTLGMMLFLTREQKNVDRAKELFRKIIEISEQHCEFPKLENLAEEVRVLL